MRTAWSLCARRALPWGRIGQPIAGRDTTSAVRGLILAGFIGFSALVIGACGGEDLPTCDEQCAAFPDHQRPTCATVASLAQACLDNGAPVGGPCEKPCYECYRHIAEDWCD